MIHLYMTVEDAIDYLVKVKYIKPDIDSLRQLAILNKKLKRSKYKCTAPVKNGA